MSPHQYSFPIVVTLWLRTFECKINWVMNKTTNVSRESRLQSLWQYNWRTTLKPLEKGGSGRFRLNQWTITQLSEKGIKILPSFPNTRLYVVRFSSYTPTRAACHTRLNGRFRSVHNWRRHNQQRMIFDTQRLREPLRKLMNLSLVVLIMEQAKMLKKGLQTTVTKDRRHVSLM